MLDLSTIIICRDDFEKTYNLIDSLHNITKEFIVISISDRDGFSYKKNNDKITFLRLGKTDDFSKVANKALRLCDGKWVLKLHSYQYIDKPNKDRLAKAIYHGDENEIYAFEAQKYLYVKNNKQWVEAAHVDFCKGYSLAIPKKDIILFRNDNRIEYECNIDEKIYYTLERESLKWLESNIILHDWSLVDMVEDYKLYVSMYEKRINENKEDIEGYYSLGRLYEAYNESQKASNVYKLSYEKFKDNNSLLYYIMSSKNISRKEEE